MTRMKMLALGLLLIAGAARAEQRLKIETAAKLQGADTKAIASSLTGEPEPGESKRRLQVKLLDEGSGSKLEIAVSGEALPADSVERMRKMFPALRDAKIELREADAEASGLPLLPPEPSQLDTPELIAAFQARLQAQLEAEGKKGTVKVRRDATRSE